MSRVDSYVYEDGNTRVRIDRIEPGRNGESKSFLPYLWNLSKGRYNEKPGLNGTKLPLYHLDEVRAAITAEQAIFFVEGEGKCDRLRAALRESGSRAAVTTIAGGANAPLRVDHVAALTGARSLFVLADSDIPGCGAASERAQAVARAYPECDVRIIDLFPDRNDGSDVADFLAEGHTVSELWDLLRQGNSVTQSAPAEPLGTQHQMQKPVPANPEAWVMVTDLLAEPERETEYLVEGLLIDGGTSLVAAKPKVGKSTLAQNLAFSVARGEPFLGRPTRRGSVLYLALEEKRSELRRHFEMMGARNGDEIAFYVSRAPDAAFEWLRAEVVKRKPVLIVVDTFQRFARLRDINDYAGVTNALYPLTHLARESGAHLMLTHHAKKSDGKDGDAVLGSTGIFGAVDTLLEMRRSDGVRSLSSIQRYGEDLESTIVALDPDTYRVAAQGSATEANRKRIETAMLEHLKSATEGESREGLFAAVEGSTTVKVSALKALIESDRISRSGEGKRSSPFLYSCFPVPAISEEQENKNPEIVGKACGIEPDSCSGDSSAPQGAEPRTYNDENPNSLSESADDLFDYAHRIGFTPGAGTPLGKLDL
jgi:hypothetical protein